MTELFADKLAAFIKVINDTSNNNNTPKYIKPFLKSMKDFSSDLVTHLDKLESRIAISENVSDLLQKKLTSLEYEIDDLEQYSRRPCLLIHGLAEEEAETNETLEEKVKDVFNTKLELGVNGGQIKTHHLDRLHRLGKRRSGNAAKPRPIIVKFNSYRQRRKVFAIKKKLKNFKTETTSIVITENLTKKKYALLNKCRDKFGNKSAWSYDGRIYAITDTDAGTKTAFTNMDELDHFLAAGQ